MLKLTLEDLLGLAYSIERKMKAAGVTVDDLADITLYIGDVDTDGSITYNIEYPKHLAYLAQK